MSWFSNRVSPTAAAVAAIFFLVVLLIIVWTTMSASGAAKSGEDYRTINETVLNVPYQFVKGQTQRIDDGAALQYRPSVRPVTEDFQVPAFPDDEVTEEIEDRDGTIKNNNIHPADSGDVIEYVIPQKISQNQYEDPPDASSLGKRHHSGNFRLPTSEIWDPHPQYEFEAFGRKFRLKLFHNSDFVATDLKVTHVRNNETTREHPTYQNRCFYHGKVEEDEKSEVTVTLCHGMMGHVITANGSYSIEPAEEWSAENDRTMKHAFQREIRGRLNVSTVSESDAGAGPDVWSKPATCGVIENEPADDLPAPMADESSAEEAARAAGRHREKRSSPAHIFWGSSRENRIDKSATGRFGRPKVRWLYPVHATANRYYSLWERHGNVRHRQLAELGQSYPWRHRRNPRQYFVELMVVADQKVAERHGDGLLNYILVLMNHVSRIYKSSSIGNPISIAVIKIMQIDDYFGTRNKSRGILAGDMLNKFCAWQKLYNPDEPSRQHHDVALLLTREKLCSGPEDKHCNTLGLARMGQMCRSNLSCAIVQDYGLSTSFTIAHEIGHVLNMPHDDDDARCSEFRVPNVLNLMAPKLDEDEFRSNWSECSRHHVTEFLETANCLLDEPSNMVSPDVRLPGENYSANKQCELDYGPGSKVCPHKRGADVCKKLWCTSLSSSGDQKCSTRKMPPADGTPCGEDQSEIKWCQNGECVSVENLEPVNGQWGEWGQYGECSRKCGGGIQRKTRECNRPPPQHGGDYCIGERIKYRSCGTDDCPLDAPDFRQEQCSKHDGDNLNIPGLENNTNIVWYAKYGLRPEDRCKLFCQLESKQYYQVFPRVTDGTPCSPDSFDICVHGQCEPAGCDHVLNSTAELDTCGVCRGDNSTCQRITGTYNSSVYGHTKVVKIPAGSINIDIRQHGWKGRFNDSNYLALRIGENGSYILNGKFVMNRKVIVLPGITIEYSGPETLVERLNSSRRIKHDLILEVLSVDALHPPQISYEYMVPKNILKNYVWTLSDWSECSHICQGTSHRVAQCQSIESKENVSGDYCRSQSKPTDEARLCNNYCMLEWQLTHMSECSNQCGPGNRTIATQCVQKMKHSWEPLAIEACSHLKRPSNVQPCVGPCDAVYWSYSDWQPCSVTCGEGTQSRLARCVTALNEVVPDEVCVAEEKIVARTCARETCPKWQIGEWSACSVSCGTGERQRTNFCHIDNRPVHADRCSGPRPDVSEICDGLCHRWTKSDWSACDTKCGEGRRYRQVVCKNTRGGIATDDKCYPAKKPRYSKKCRRKVCRTSTFSAGNSSREKSRCRWRVSNWSPCTSECGEGVQHRSVMCHIVNRFGYVDPRRANCCMTEKRPSDYRQCKLRECDDKFFWMPGSWRKCNRHCGRRGKQTRPLFCVDSGGRKTALSKCPTKFMPRRERKCNQRRCGPRTCAEAKKRLKSIGDGEYMLLIGGKLMRIYCYDTASQEPREYLTLPAGDGRNYAEIYNKTLLNPSQCPYNGRFNDSCECVSNAQGNWGFTEFKRVRIDPARLTIVADDFTFARTTGSKQQFGQAGDCYSREDCPQGRFSIDLTGTPLRLSPDVKWGPKRSRAFLKINRVNDQRVIGRCGGYCGYCWPITGLKLDVLPP